MRKPRQFVQRKNNIKCKATRQGGKATENTADVADLQTKRVQGKEGKLSNFQGTVFKEQVEDELRETQTKGGKHRTEDSRERQPRRKAHITTEITSGHSHARCSVSLNSEETMGWLLFLSWQGVSFGVTWFENSLCLGRC